MARTIVREEFAESVKAVLVDPRVRLVYVTPELLARAVILYEQRTDKTWGLVDCASFVVMQDEGVAGAFTNDEHFTVFGRCYDAGPYRRAVRYRLSAVVPPLSREREQWAERILREKGVLSASS